MNSPCIRYFEQEDVLHLMISEEPENRSVELNPNITVELNDKNEMIGVEILHASSFLRDAVLDSIQAKTLQLIEAGGEVSHISQHGIWLLLQGREMFLSYQNFPWFKDAPVSSVLNIKLPQPHHLYWPDLDIDLAVESIEHPDRFPLVAR